MFEFVELALARNCLRILGGCFGPFLRAHIELLVVLGVLIWGLHGRCSCCFSCLRCGLARDTGFGGSSGFMFGCWGWTAVARYEVEDGAELVEDAVLGCQLAAVGERDPGA